MTTVQVVDSMSSVVDLQILAIEKTLLSIDRYMQTNMNDDIAKLITSFNIGVRSFISKVLEKNSHRSNATKISKSSKSLKDNNRSNIQFGSKQFGSPNRFRRSAQTSKLESSQRWRIFLSDDPDFRRFLDSPCKRMVRHLEKMYRHIILRRSYVDWKKSADLAENFGSVEHSQPSFDGITVEEGHPLDIAGANSYDQEFIWDDPSFNPYEDEGEEKLQVIQSSNVIDTAEDTEVFNAVDGRPLDVEELRAPFSYDIMEKEPLQEKKKVSHFQFPDSAMSNHDSSSTQNIVSRMNSFAQNVSSSGTAEISLANGNKLSRPLESNGNDFDVSQKRNFGILDDSTSLAHFSSSFDRFPTTIPSSYPRKSTVSIEDLLRQSRSLPPTAHGSNPLVPVEFGTAIHKYDSTPMMPYRQSVEQNSSSFDDGGMDDGFELPP